MSLPDPSVFRSAQFNVPIYGAYEIRSKSPAAPLLGIPIAVIALGIIAAGFDNARRLGPYSWLLYAPICAFLLWLGLWYMTIKPIRKYRKLKKEYAKVYARMQQVRAKVVGRERTDGGEYADIFSVLYQFNPEFIVMATDKTDDYKYYALPEGAEVDVLFDPYDPRISVLKRG